MDLLKSQLDRIQKQLAGLNASQKMLVAALAAIMVITVVWWGKYAGEAEMVPLLEQSFSAVDLGRIQQHLELGNVAFTVSGDKLLVPADKRMQILAELTYSRMMPQDTQKGFDEIVKEISPFDSQEKQATLWNHGKETVLSQLIGSFPQVASAEVMIDPTSTVRIENSVDPTATVIIRMQDGIKPSSKMVDAAAYAVVGAVSGMKASAVRVVVDGQAMAAHDSQDGLSDGSEQFALMHQAEADAAAKVRMNYSDIKNLLVTVKMKLNTTSIQTEKHEYDNKGVIQKAIKSNSETEKTSTPGGRSGGEAGAVSNTELVVNPSGGGGGGAGGQEREKTEDTFVVAMPDTRTVSHTPAGDATPVSATVRVPQSYMNLLYRSQNASTQTPTYAQLKPLIEEQSAKFCHQVAYCVGLASPEMVAFEVYPDEMPSLSSPPLASASTGGLSLLVGGHAKEIALGTLAVMSLFMASMMVRKASPTPIPAMAAAPVRSESERKKGPFTFAGEDLAGEATGSEGLLDALELNEETVKAGRMVEQVSSMVRENPDAAAALMKRWLSRA